MKNSEAKGKLNIKYGARCLLTNLKGDRLTYHHCLLKKQHGGKATVENGAQMINEIHQWLHKLENTDIELFDLVNECLDLYKQVMDLGLTELIEQYETECIPEYRKKVMR